MKWIFSSFRMRHSKIDLSSGHLWDRFEFKAKWFHECALHFLYTKRIKYVQCSACTWIKSVARQRSMCPCQGTAVQAPTPAVFQTTLWPKFILVWVFFKQWNPYPASYWDTPIYFNVWPSVWMSSMLCSISMRPKYPGYWRRRALMTNDGKPSLLPLHFFHQ